MDGDKPLSGRVAAIAIAVLLILSIALVWYLGRHSGPAPDIG